MNKTFTRRKEWILAGILLAAWTPWVILCFPGNLPWDAGAGIAWFLDIDRSNPNNPYFQNLLMGLFIRAGNVFGAPEGGLFVYCLLQMILEAGLLGKIIAYLREQTRAGKAAYLLFLLYGLLPVFPIYAFTMGKDSNLAIAILAMVFLLIRAATEGNAFWAQRRNRAKMAVMPAVLGLLRNFAGVVPLLIVGVLALKARRKAGWLTAGAAVLALLLATLAIPRLAGIPETEIRESMSMPLQTAAYYVQEASEKVTEEERAIIESVTDWRVFSQEYDPMNADVIKNKTFFTPETRASFLRMWGGMLRKRPDLILTGWRYGTDLYFSLSEVSWVKDHVCIGIRIDSALQEKLGLTAQPERTVTAERTFQWFLDLPAVHELMCIGLYTWIALGMTGVSLIFRRLRKLLPCCLLLTMVLAGCLLSPVNGYYRYAYPMILSVPVILTVMAALCFSGRTSVSS